MSANGLDLLSSLGSTVRGAGDRGPGSPSVGPGVGSIDSAGFGALLERAGGGSIATGKPVAIDPALGLELSREQLDSLAAAADRAQATGARRAAVVLDGRVYELDVASRKIVGEIRPASGEVATGIDALIRLGDGDDEDGPSSSRLLETLGGG